ncbi:DUF6624 domain-containing protein [Streptomyces aureus]|uniref:DUF6624 domain-containing protein n=1 Tax=Streptomyces aureus TaxID=193461 RepID=UPI000564906F|nr:DUF6624 domain-containing protein [Streptomyces aureus]
MTAGNPLRPDLAHELISRAQQEAERWARHVRNELDSVHLGQGRHADHVNAKMLARVLADHGWPGHRLVGPAASRAAWLLALHADDEPDFQRTAARLLHRAAQAGDACLQQWAHLQDRALVNSLQSQEFGTQYRLGPDGLEPYPIREPDLLEARRGDAGLLPSAAVFAALQQRLSAPASPGTHDDTIRLTALAGAA